MTENTPHIVILGAGPAGVGAAFRLRQSAKAEVTVLERAPAVGGNAGSFEVAGQRVDFGSHRLHPSCDPHILADIRTLLGSELVERPRHGRIRLRGRWIHFPLKPLDLLLRLDRRFAFGASWDMLTGSFRRVSEGAPTFASVLRAQLGPTICDQFYLPYAKKIWGLEPDHISDIQARRRVSAGTFAKLLRKVFGGLPGVKPVGFDFFYYPKNGYGQISEAYAQTAEQAGARIVSGQPVVRLEPPRSPEDSWTAMTETDHGQESYEADQIWSTIPISTVAHLIDPAPPREILEAAAAIRSRAMILVYLHLPCDRFTEYDAHYFPDPTLRITRLSEPKNYTAQREPAGSTVLCAELPCSVDDEVWGLSNAELGELVATDLDRAGIPLTTPAVSVETRRLPQAYPIYDLGFHEHLTRLEAWVGSLPRFLTYGRQGLFVHDNTHHALYMAYCAVDSLVDGQVDKERWEAYLEVFETHVVED